MKMSIKSIILSTSASSLLMASAGAAQAQSNETDDSDENIIIVSAKNRIQSLQEVPLPITVFNANALEERGIEDVQELAAFTPNFNIYSGNGRQDATGLNVRGLSANTSDERYQPVSFFVDGIFMGGVTVGLQTINVQRIEVIKGPQSATFGRATYAGAIDFVTTTPSLTDFGGKFSGEISSHTSDNTNYKVSGMLEGPIIADKLSASLFVQSQLKDGFSQVPGGQFSEIGEEKTFALNGVIFAQMGESTSLKLRGIYSNEDDQDGLNHTTQPLYWEQQGANIVTLPNGSLFIQGNVPDPIRSGIRGVDLPNPAVADPAAGGYARERYFGSAILTHEFDNGTELSYRGSYLLNKYDGNIDFRSRTFVGIDPIFGQVTAADQAAGFGFALRFPFPFQEEFEETSHQIRVVSPDNEGFRWATGLYYYWSADRNFQLRSDRTPLPGNEVARSRGDGKIINVAGFGSLEVDLSDTLTFGFEGRLQTEEVRFEALTTATSSASRFDQDLSTSNMSFEPRITLDYQPNEDQLYYVLFSKGVKSGRYNTSSTAPAVNGLRPEASYLFAPPEKLYNYEVGGKFTFLNGNATLNIAAFYQDVVDQQLRQSVETTFDFDNNGVPDVFNQIFTAGDSRIYGFEIEGTAKFDSLSLQAAVGYADHEFSDDISPPADSALFQFADGVAAGQESLRGKTSSNVPKLTASFSAQYDTSVGSNWDFSLRGDVNYTGSRYVDLANVAKMSGYALVNARATLNNDNLTFSIFGNNLFNDRTAVGAGLNSTSTCEFQRNGPNLPAYDAQQRCIFLVPQRGREIGVSASFSF